MDPTTPDGPSSKHSVAGLPQVLAATCCHHESQCLTSQQTHLRPRCTSVIHPHFCQIFRLSSCLYTRQDLSLECFSTSPSWKVLFLEDVSQIYLFFFLSFFVFFCFWGVAFFLSFSCVCVWVRSFRCFIFILRANVLILRNYSIVLKFVWYALDPATFK